MTPKAIMAALIGVIPAVLAIALISRVPQLKQLIFNTRPR